MMRACKLFWDFLPRGARSDQQHLYPKTTKMVFNFFIFLKLPGGGGGGTFLTNGIFGVWGEKGFNFLLKKLKKKTLFFSFNPKIIGGKRGRLPDLNGVYLWGGGGDFGVQCVF